MTVQNSNIRKGWRGIWKEHPEINDTDILLNVKSFGAVGDGVTDDTDAVELAYSSITDDLQTVFFPPSTGSYYVTRNFFAAMPSTTDAQYGTRRQMGTTVLYGDITTNAPLIVPHQHRIIGAGRKTNANAGSGGTIKAASTFPTNSTLIRMGEGTNYIVHGIQLIDVHLDGNDVVGITAIEGDGLQEGCGLYRVILQNFSRGVYFGYGQSGTVDGRNCNFIVEDCEFYLRVNASAPCFDLYNSGGPTIIRRCTASAFGTLTSHAAVGYRIAGTNVMLQGNHAEYCLAGIQLGATILDVSSSAQAGLETQDISIDNCTVTHPTTYGGNAVDACPAVVAILDNNAANAVTAVSMRHVRGLNNITNLIRDEGDTATGRTALTLPWATYPNVNGYQIANAHSGSSIPPPTTTTAHDGVRNVTVAAGGSNNLDPTFARYLRVSCSASAGTITGLAGGYYGRYIHIVNQSSFDLILPHRNANSSATAQFQTNTGADLTVSTSCCAELVYGIGQNTQKWFVRKT